MGGIIVQENDMGGMRMAKKYTEYRGSGFQMCVYQGIYVGKILQEFEGDE